MDISFAKDPSDHETRDHKEKLPSVMWVQKSTTVMQTLYHGGANFIPQWYEKVPTYHRWYKLCTTVIML